MSLKASNKIETNTYALTITISAEDFNAAVQKVFQKQRKSIALPGFRKGKATLGMVERFYGKGVFYEDALELVYPDAVDAAVEEAGLEIVAAPYDVDVKEIGENGVEMDLKVTVKPEVTVDGYKGIEAEKADVRVTAAEVKEEIEQMRERNSRMVTVEDRDSKNGDTAVFDFEGFCDGVAFDGGKAENYSLELGSNQFIPGFEDQLCGHKAGDEFDVNVTFPEEYGASELAGKPAVFKIKLHEVKVKELPELDDDFAKDVGEDYETVADLQAGVKKEITERKKKSAQDAFEDAVMHKLAELVQGEIPEVMFENKAKEDADAFAQRIGQQGLDLDTYLMYCGIEKEKFEADMLEQATLRVKVQLALEKVAELEKIEVSDETVEAKYAELAATYQIDVDTVKKLVSDKSIRADLSNEAASKVVLESAKPVKPAKKTAAKKTTKKAAKEEETAEAAE